MRTLYGMLCSGAFLLVTTTVRAADLSASIQNVTHTFLLGQPVTVHALLANITDNPASYAIIPGSDAISVTMKNEGERAKFDVPQLPSLGGSSPIYTVAAKEVKSIPIDAGRYVKLDEARDYLISISVHIPTSRSSRPFRPDALAEANGLISVRIIPSTPEMLLQWLRVQMANWSNLDESDRYDFLRGIAFSSLGKNPQAVLLMSAYLNERDRRQLLILLLENRTWTAGALSKTFAGSNEIALRMNVLLREVAAGEASR